MRQINFLHVQAVIARNATSSFPIKVIANSGRNRYLETSIPKNGDSPSVREPPTWPIRCG